MPTSDRSGAEWSASALIAVAATYSATPIITTLTASAARRSTASPPAPCERPAPNRQISTADAAPSRIEFAPNPSSAADDTASPTTAEETPAVADHSPDSEHQRIAAVLRWSGDSVITT